MKLKILVGAVALLALLYVANRRLNPPSSSSTPAVATATTPAGEVREVLVVGHLPVT
jgi:hypothetical protein